MVMLTYLIGYRGVGKTSVGRLAAQELGCKFIDIDNEVQRKKSASICEIVAEEGWGGFRKAEAEELFKTLSRSQSVVSTGGGAVLHGEFWQQAKGHARVIWLSAQRVELAKRIRGDEKSKTLRPSLTGKSEEQEFEIILNEREPLYRQIAHHHVDTTELSIAEVSEKLVEMIRSSSLE